MVASSLVAADPGNYTLPYGRGSLTMFSAFNRCPACFHARYVEPRPRTISVALPIGSGFHRALELARRAIKNGKPLPTIDDYVEAAIVGFDEACVGMSREGELPDPDLRPIVRFGTKYLSQAAAVEQLTDLVKRIVPTIAERDQALGVRHVEEELDFDGVFPFPFTGWLDAFTGDGAIVEGKTAGNRNVRPATPVALAVMGLHWWKVGEPVALKVDLVLKTKWPELLTWVVKPTDAQFRAAEHWVLQTAGAITGAMRSGCFPVNLEALSHDVDHGLPKGNQVL